MVGILASAMENIGRNKMMEQEEKYKWYLIFVTMFSPHGIVTRRVLRGVAHATERNYRRIYEITSKHFDIPESYIEVRELSPGMILFFGVNEDYKKYFVSGIGRMENYVVKVDFPERIATSVAIATIPTDKADDIKVMTAIFHHVPDTWVSVSPIRIETIYYFYPNAYPFERRL